MAEANNIPDEGGDGTIRAAACLLVRLRRKWPDRKGCGWACIKILRPDRVKNVNQELREYLFDLKSVQPTADVLAGLNCVPVATDHDDFDYANIRRHAAVIVDTRGRYRQSCANVVKACVRSQPPFRRYLSQLLAGHSCHGFPKAFK